MERGREGGGGGGEKGKCVCVRVWGGGWQCSTLVMVSATHEGEWGGKGVRKEKGRVEGVERDRQRKRHRERDG